MRDAVTRSSCLPLSHPEPARGRSNPLQPTAHHPETSANALRKETSWLHVRDTTGRKICNETRHVGVSWLPTQYRAVTEDRVFEKVVDAAEFFGELFHETNG